MFEGINVPFTLDLDQTGEDVTGTWAYLGTDFPIKGTFDGAKLNLQVSIEDQTVTFIADVLGNNMSGTLDDGEGNTGILGIVLVMVFVW